MIVKTINNGGASPVSALIEADKMIKYQDCNLIAIVSGDSVASMGSSEFLHKANKCWAGLCNDDEPIIPKAYNKVAEWLIT